MQYPVQIGTGTSIYPTSIRIQEIEGPRRSIVPQEVRDAEALHASITVIYSKRRDLAPTWSKVISRKFANKFSADVYLRCQMNFASDTVLSKSRNFMYLGLSYVNTTNELMSVFAPTTRIGLPTHVSNWFLRSHRIIEATADRVSGSKS